MQKTIQVGFVLLRAIPYKVIVSTQVSSKFIKREVVVLVVVVQPEIAYHAFENEEQQESSRTAEAACCNNSNYMREENKATIRVMVNTQ